MTLQEMTGLGKKLAAFLALFKDCFGRGEGRVLLAVYVKGLLSDVQRKTAEAIALRFGTAPRTLQRFLESIKWNEERLRERCQRIVASQHKHPRAVGVIDESAVSKSGSHTVGVQRQWCGREGKVDNCVVGVHWSYVAPGFQCLLDSELYLPEDWANDPVRRKKTMYPRLWNFARSPGLPWGSSIAPWRMESKWPRGRSTSFTVVTTNSWMAWKSAGRRLLPKFPSLSTDGYGGRSFCIPARKEDLRSIHAWPAARRQAKSATYFDAHLCFATRPGSSIASRTRTKGRKSGRSNGLSSGARESMACQGVGTA
jgi:hypothetical protein